MTTSNLKSADKARLAFDRGTVRRIDKDGRLHVAITNISKANVCPYLGSEIPDGEALGLKPDKVYQLLRDPEELEKAASTFNSVPLMAVHKPSTANDHPREVVVGTTGNDAVFEAPYLKNSLVVWDGEAIQGIDTEEQQELSCGYRYRADMTPGIYDGTPYDGVMRDIHGNHVALVATGRAGPDVVVGDSQMEKNTMKKPLSRKATLAKGALLAHLAPRLATDAKFDLNPILVGVTNANWKEKKPGILAEVKKAKLAKDADIGDVVKLLDGLDGEEPDDADMAAVDGDPLAEIMAMLTGKLSDEDLAAVKAKLTGMAPAATDGEEDGLVAKIKALLEEAAKPTGATDNPPPTDGTPKPPTGEPDKDMVSKPAMDAAIKKAKEEATAAALATARAISAAEKVVKPYVGEIAAQDSAEAVYRVALTTLGVDIKDIHPSAFRAVLEAQPKPGEQRARIAQDSATVGDDFAKRFPDATRITS
jgi:hypothetical protein